LSACRSLFPLIGVYFKQLGLNPAETGMLMGRCSGDIADDLE